MLKAEGIARMNPKYTVVCSGFNGGSFSVLVTLTRFSGCFDTQGDITNGFFYLNEFWLSILVLSTLTLNLFFYKCSTTTQYQLLFQLIRLILHQENTVITRSSLASAHCFLPSNSLNGLF